MIVFVRHEQKMYTVSFLFETHSKNADVRHFLSSYNVATMYKIFVKCTTHIKIQYALHIYSTMCKTYGIQRYGIYLRGANSKYKGIMVSSRKAIHKWTS